MIGESLSESEVDMEKMAREMIGEAYRNKVFKNVIEQMMTEKRYRAVIKLEELIQEWIEKDKAFNNKYYI